jgi:hypothetical protein
MLANNMAVLWLVAPCSLPETGVRFRVEYCRHFHVTVGFVLELGTIVLQLLSFTLMIIVIISH